MKFLKVSFYLSNLALIILYLYPGSLIGCLFYNDCQIEPKITKDFLTPLVTGVTLCIIKEGKTNTNPASLLAVGKGPSILPPLNISKSPPSYSSGSDNCTVIEIFLLDNYPGPISACQ